MAGALAAVAMGLGGAGFLAFRHWVPASEVKIEAPTETAAPAKKPVFVNPIIDLAGDPLIIRLGDQSEANTKLHEVEVTPELKQPALSDGVEVLSDVMLSSSQRIMALPSSPEDFAFFQSQSARGQPRVSFEPVAAEPVIEESVEEAEPEAIDPDSEEVLVPVSGQDDLDGDEALAAPEEEPILEVDGRPTVGLTPPQPATGEIGEPDADLGAGWGETISEGQEALPSFKKTAVDDTTTVYLVRPEIDRFRQVEDFTVSVKGDRPLDSIVTEYGFSAEEGKSAAEAAKRLLGVEALAERTVVGLRGYRSDSKGSRLRLVQVSINSPDKKYLGTIALADDGTFVSGADPWINEDLSQYAENQTEVAQPQSYRLLDAIYSTATRNNVPSSVTGEAIMLISRAFDLQALATKDDRLVLAFAKKGRDESGTSGRVLYVAVHGVDRNFECFVYQPQPGAAYSCMSEKDATHSLTVTNGMVTPVNGVLTSTFGPRRHPILNVVRLHKGVDWRAPVGTPIMAAFEGTIEFAGDGKGYGNVIRIAHGGGRATAYAHMSRFEPGMSAGVKVNAGDVIG
jgi:murein DD-endopeptidase MepM/ murein hydrolase activator NlpD